MLRSYSDKLPKPRQLSAFQLFDISHVNFMVNGKNVNLYHVTKFSLFLMFIVHYFYKKVSCFTP